MNKFEKIKYLNPNEKYKVSGKLLHLILDLSNLYREPLLVVKGGYCEQGSMLRTDKEQIQIIPFQTEKRDYLIGRLVQEFQQWLEQEIEEVE